MIVKERLGGVIIDYIYEPGDPQYDPSGRRKGEREWIPLGWIKRPLDRLIERAERARSRR